jgi:predicted DNA-binding transcriptional regulator AlpA
MSTDKFLEQFRDARVISESEAATYASFSLQHFRRMRREGRGPRYVQLGERRVGYRLCDLKAWVDARLSPEPNFAA